MRTCKRPRDLAFSLQAAARLRLDALDSLLAKRVQVTTRCELLRHLRHRHLRSGPPLLPVSLGSLTSHRPSSSARRLYPRSLLRPRQLTLHPHPSLLSHLLHERTSHQLLPVHHQTHALQNRPVAVCSPEVRPSTASTRSPFVLFFPPSYCHTSRGRCRRRRCVLAGRRCAHADRRVWASFCQANRGMA